FGGCATARQRGDHLVQRARSKPTAFQAVSFQQVGSDGCFEPAEHVGLAGPRVPPMKKLPLAGGAGATFSRARSLPPSGGCFFNIRHPACESCASCVGIAAVWCAYASG